MVIVKSIAVLLFNIFTIKGIPIAVSVPLLHKPLITGKIIQHNEGYLLSDFLSSQWMKI